VIHAVLAIALALYLGAASAQPATPPSPAPDAGEQARILKLSEKLRCLVCQNQSLADSNAELALDLRRELREQVSAGRSDDQIVEFMVERYGDFVLYKPPFKLTTALLWVGPFVLLAVAATALFVMLRRRRSLRAEPELGDEERRLVERVLGSGKTDERSP